MNTEKYTIYKSNFMKKIHDPVHILIGGDFVPTISNKYLFEKGNIDDLMGKDLTDKLLEADIRVFNLEAPITDSTEKTPKCGSPNLKTYEDSINILKKLKPLILSAANNHIYDYGETGIDNTKRILESNNIKSVGFGKTSAEAKSSFFYTINELKIGIYACAENEFSCITENRGGANGFDPLNSFDDVRASCISCDYQIVLFHGGRENYRYPTPQLKKICHKFIDCGADLIICQHSHCIGCYEEYKQGCIIYGQGNFLFDINNREEWQTSLLVELFFEKDAVTINVYPLEKDNNKVSLVVNNKLRNKIMLGFIERSENIKKDEFVRNEYIKFSQNQASTLLLRGIMGINSKWILGLNKILKNRILRKLFREERNRLLLNYLKCESICESILLLLEENNISNL